MAPSPHQVLRPGVAEAWARSQASLDASLTRGECSAYAIAVRQRFMPLGSLQRGFAQCFERRGDLSAPLTPLRHPTPVTERHVFDWASVTKALAAQLLCMQLVAQGVLQPNDLLGTFVPALARGAHRAITVSHALHYRTGWPAWRPLYTWTRQREQLAEALAAVPLEAPPGARRCYSDLGHLALTQLLEAVLQMRLDDAFAQRIARPAALLRCGYCPQSRALGPAVATSFDNVFERRLLRERGFALRAHDAALDAMSFSFDQFRHGAIVGEVDDGNAHYLMGGVSGHAGLFGDAADMATLAEAMVLGGPNEAALGLTPSVRAEFVRLDEHGGLPTWWHGHELGPIGLPTPRAGELAPAVMMRGFAGTMVYVEPAKQLTVAVLSNREHVNGQGVYVNLRPVFCDVVDVWRSL